MLNEPVPVYGAVPPVAVTFTVVVPPLQLIAPAEAEAFNCEGWLTVATADTVYPLASVTTYV